jgi:2-aminoadipate transaminase
LIDIASIRIDNSSEIPVYRQVADAIARSIEDGVFRPGHRLPPTRELAGLLQLNRTTVSAAYAHLERLGLLEGKVGRGSFVAAGTRSWTRKAKGAAPAAIPEISFASSRPASREFPLEAFRRLAREVIDSEVAAEILQLGDARGFGPLRKYLFEEASAREIASPADDLLITNGCQQSLDLIARVFGGPGRGIAVEDPGYHGMLRAFSRTGAVLFGVPVDEHGIDPAALEQVLLRHRPAVVAVTPSFQNPTGATLPLERRQQIAALTGAYDFLLVEIDIYSDLRYRGNALPALKSLAPAGHALLLGSYSKVAFPGLRVGWTVGPRSLIARLSEAKEISDLHSDQLSQAVLLRFAQSGELKAHLTRTLVSNGRKLDAALQACESYFPGGTRWTTPEGGLNLWIELPAPLTADLLLEGGRAEGVRFLPGRQFAVREQHSRCLRISFGGLTPDEIETGLQMLGRIAAAQLTLLEETGSEQSPAVV